MVSLHDEIFLIKNRNAPIRRRLTDVNALGPDGETRVADHVTRWRHEIADESSQQKVIPPKLTNRRWTALKSLTRDEHIFKDFSV